MKNAKPIIAAFIIVFLVSLSSCRKESGERNITLPDTTASANGDGD